jgi:hypothetical protein
MQVSHYILQQCDCPNCGKTVKATLPSGVSTGYGPHFTALIGELSGIKSMSRNDVKQLWESVLGIPIATGIIEKIVDRNSNALLSVYEHIGRVARLFWCIVAKAQLGNAKQKMQPVGGTDLVFERNLPLKCRTDIPVSRRMYCFLFTKVDAQFLLDLTQTGISREHVLQKRTPFATTVFTRST